MEYDLTGMLSSPELTSHSTYLSSNYLTQSCSLALTTHLGAGFHEIPKQVRREKGERLCKRPMSALLSVEAKKVEAKMAQTSKSILKRPLSAMLATDMDVVPPETLRPLSAFLAKHTMEKKEMEKKDEEDEEENMDQKQPKASPSNIHGFLPCKISTLASIEVRSTHNI